MPARARARATTAARVCCCYAMLLVPSVASAQQTPATTPPPPPPPQPAPEPEKPVSWAFLDAHLRVSTLKVSDRKPLVGAAVGMNIDWIFPSRIMNGRVRSTYRIGGGGGVVEGVVAGNFSYGARLPVGENHGPFVRLAVGFRYEGNNDFLTSHLQLPQGQVGYQALSDRVFFELTGTAAPVLAGRLNTGDDGTRSLDGSFGWGGIATFMLRPFGVGLVNASYTGIRMDAELLRVQAQSAPKTPVDQLRAHLCAVDFVAVCADASWTSGDQDSIRVPGGTTFRDVTAFYGGISIGLGAVFADTM